MLLPFVLLGDFIGVYNETNVNYHSYAHSAIFHQTHQATFKIYIFILYMYAYKLDLYITLIFIMGFFLPLIKKIQQIFIKCS